ncbi:hypothetical protein [Mycolicibacterium porcinum]|uniref:hypothetical protein n=1 Tax=Mycolicibacterium porcinum TaxID=39693 RepID=UPI001C97DF13|nr:hypothetical protein [Mycolicibacterium porcinum]
MACEDGRYDSGSRSRRSAADPARESSYDSFAEGYTAENETSLLNAFYERPAMLELAGNVTGRRILDAGCGSGPLFAALRDRGAVMTGIDMALPAARELFPDGYDESTGMRFLCFLFFVLHSG